MSDRSAGSNELAIFIDSDDHFRILVPKNWDEEDSCPRLALLVVASVLRLTNPDESNFLKSMEDWAEEHLTEDEPTLNVPPKSALN